jgi:shikimate kinase
METAPNLVLVGPMGAGKSAIGRRLAERLGLPFADLDDDIEAATGAAIPLIFDCEGEPGFRARERAALQERLAGAGLALATGGGAVLDPLNRRLLRERGYVVWLRSAVDTQLERLSRCGHRPLLQQADRGDVLRRLATEREPLYQEVADLAFDTDGMTPGEAAGALATLVHARWRAREQA